MESANGPSAQSCIQFWQQNGEWRFVYIYLESIVNTQRDNTLNIDWPFIYRKNIVCKNKDKNTLNLCMKIQRAFM